MAGSNGMTPPGWEARNGSLERVFRFDDGARQDAFVERAMGLADALGRDPQVRQGRGEVRVLLRAAPHPTAQREPDAAFARRLNDLAGDGDQARDGLALRVFRSVLPIPQGGEQRTAHGADGRFVSGPDDGSGDPKEHKMATARLKAAVAAHLAAAKTLHGIEMDLADPETPPSVKGRLAGRWHEVLTKEVEPAEARLNAAVHAHPDMATVAEHMAAHHAAVAKMTDELDAALDRAGAPRAEAASRASIEVRVDASIASVTGDRRAVWRLLRASAAHVRAFDPAREAEARAAREGDGLVGRDAFLYMEPPPGDPDGGARFAQCATCAYSTGAGHCLPLGAAFRIEAGGSCGLYAHGERPLPADVVGEALVSPAVAGYVVREVRCENCRSFDPAASECGLYRTMDRDQPDVYALGARVSPKGCCNAQEPRDSAQRAFNPDQERDANGRFAGIAAARETKVSAGARDALAKYGTARSRGVDVHTIRPDSGIPTSAIDELHRKGLIQYRPLGGFHLTDIGHEEAANHAARAAGFGGMDEKVGLSPAQARGVLALKNANHPGPSDPQLTGYDDRRLSNLVSPKEMGRLVKAGLVHVGDFNPGTYGGGRDVRLTDRGLLAARRVKDALPKRA